MAQIGICIWSIPGSSDREKIQLASTCGLDGVQLELGGYEEGFPLSKKERQQEAIALRDDLGILYPTLGLNVFCGHSATNQKDHDIIRRAIDCALETALALDIKLLQCPSFFASEIKDEAGLENTAKIFQYACRQAADTPVLVSSENILQPDALSELVKAVDAPNFRIYFDTANPYWMAGMPAIPLLDAALPWLAEVHLKESKDDGSAAFLGEGDSDFFATFNHLMKANYAGWLVLENGYGKLMSERSSSAEEVIRADLKIVRDQF
ncbi:sugar phosphate isomerase/epimerase family protein [Rubellicoccus peritrichatus]|uniref:Sugar phosphate isomerase/epimerase family protein n=1 Tax=Rubellicoccus peritrichatus TaxID=3080537 RepID=A0AAQ3LBZ8_9BACT|nr:sugar phosphate isomerase/epimerase family protein [Puniceicoccus sp. CR14]WOO42507.1 sugar phosphate isomerase/epimerase family protein [Puniceicoccus sp. CR14]